jgi:hypothetical protein
MVDAFLLSIHSSLHGVTHGQLFPVRTAHPSTIVQDVLISTRDFSRISQVYLVILCMSADEFNEQRLPAVIHGRYQAVVIAPDIENHPAIGNETGTSIHGFGIVWPTPLCLSCFVAPGFQGLFRILDVQVVKRF